MELICIKCPRGCNISIEGDKISGNLCPRGEEYAKEEMTCPMRMVTALMKTKNGQIVPVKTSREVPKTDIDKVLDEISKVSAEYTKIGDIVIKNVANLGVDIVITGEPYIAD
ncbi:MAG: DUF1667 domain-containing protein [Christensenellales bacterium]